MDENRNKGNDRTWMKGKLQNMDENQNKGNGRTWVITRIRETTEHG